MTEWKDHDFERVYDAVWKNSYGNEFFAQLEQHIQNHFPVLVIPTIVKNFEAEISNGIGELDRISYCEINSSEDNYETAKKKLDEQKADLSKFLSEAKEMLIEPINFLKEEFKKKPSSMTNTLEIFHELLCETKIYSGNLSEDKLSPLFTWNANIKGQALGILAGMKQSLISGRRDFKTTSAENLPEHLQQSLAEECQIYANAYKDIQKKEKNNELDGSYNVNVQRQLDNFLKVINEIICQVINIHSDLENKRIHDTVDLLMQYYLSYLRQNTKDIASEWNLSINNSVLNNLQTPKINPINFKVEVSNKQRKKHYGFLWLRTKYIDYKTLPSFEDLHNDVATALITQLDDLLIPFQEMFEQYFLEFHDNIIIEKERVLQDFEHKLEMAHQRNDENYEKKQALWKPLKKQSEKLNNSMEQLANHWDKP